MRRALVGEGLAEKRRGWPTHRFAVVVLASYVLLAMALSLSGWSHGGARAIGRGGDPSIFVFWLRYVPWAVGHGHNPLVARVAMAPHGVNAMWNTSVILPGLLLSAVTAMFGPVVAYNVAVIGSVALSAWIAFLMASRYVPRRVAAVVAGTAYGFGPFVMAHARGHINLAAVMFPPLLFMLFDDLLRRRLWPARRTGLLLGATLAAQALTSVEVFAICALAALPVLVWFVARRRGDRVGLRYAATALAVAAGGFLVIAGLPLAVQLAGPFRVDRVDRPPDVFVTDLANFALPTKVQAVSPGTLARRFSGNLSEQNGFLGVLAVPLLLTAWRRRRDALTRSVVALAAVSAVLAFGPTLHLLGRDTHVPLPGVLFQHLPLASSILAARWTLLLWVAASLLLAWTIDDALTASRKRMGTLVVTAVGVALLAPAPLPSRPMHTPAFFRDDRLPTGTVTLIAPVLDQGSEAMRWQASGGFHLRTVFVNAVVPDDDNFVHTSLYALLSHAETAPDSGPPSPTTLTAAAAELDRLGVGAVVLAPGAGHRAEMTALTSLLHGPPTYRGGVWIWQR